jgi:hypothetical protein
MVFPYDTPQIAECNPLIFERNPGDALVPGEYHPPIFEQKLGVRSKSTVMSLRCHYFKSFTSPNPTEIPTSLTTSVSA